MLRHVFALSLAACIAAPVGQAALAQPAPYPSRPVKVIVPFAPAGSSDAIARPFTDKLSQALGQQFVIENKGGASGAIGAEAVAKAPNDGYTILISPTATLLIVPKLRKTNYDPINDFIFVANLGNSFAALSVHPSVPANTFKEFVEYARQNRGKVYYATAGIGSGQHLRNELISRMGDMGLIHIPYRGSGEALQDLLAGQVQMMTEVVTLPMVRAGKLKALAIMDRERNPDFPDVPTLLEAGRDIGFANFEMPTWFALFAPAGTPPEIVTKLNAVIVDAARDKVFADQLYKIGYRTSDEKPDELARMMLRHRKIYSDLIDDIGLKSE